MEELDNLPSPKVVLTTSATLESGYAKELFLRWAPDSSNSVIFTSATPPNSLATRVKDLFKDESSDRTIACEVCCEDVLLPFGFSHVLHR